MASSLKTIRQYTNSSATENGDTGSAAAPMQAKPSAKWKRPLHVTYWNVNGMGGEWDGHHCSKLAALQESGPYDAILLVETHLRLSLPVGLEWVVSEPVTKQDKSAGALIWLGPRLRHAMVESGHEGCRLAWARIRTTATSDILLVTHYIAHHQRTPCAGWQSK